MPSMEGFFTSVSRDVSRGLQGAFAGAGSALSSAGAALTAGATAALSAAGVAAGRYALDVASAAETTEMSFTTMLGSGEAARDMMESLADFAASTPFELSGLQTATRQLLAYGFSAEDVVPMLTAVGDATAALGTGQSGIDSVTRALGQMQAKQKVSAEEMLQLTEQGIPAWEYLARSIGTDTAGAMELVSKGAVSASDGIAAILDGMGQDFGGLMEAQSRTVAGLMSNLSDAVEQPLMALRDTSGYEALADGLSRVVDAAGPLVESVLPLLDSGLSALGGLLSSAAEGASSLSSAAAQNELVSLVGGLASLGPAAVAGGSALSALAPLAGALGSASDGALGSVAGLLGELGDGSKVVSRASGALDGARRALGGVATDATAGVQSLLMISDIEGPAGAARAAVESLGESAAGALGAMRPKAVSAFTSALSLSARGVGSLVSVLGGASLGLVALSAGIAAVAAVAAAGGADLQGFGIGLSAAILDAGSMAEGLVSSVADAIPSAVAGVQAEGPMIVNALLSALSGIGAAAARLLPAFTPQ